MDRAVFSSWGQRLVRRALPFATLLFLLAVAAGPAVAQPHAPAMADHRTWTQSDGAPGEISGLVQSADGLLWLSSSSGLYTYDGLSFRRWSQPGATSSVIGNASALWADPQGGIWVGHRFGRVVHILGQEVQVYEQAQGLPAGVTVVGFAREPSGRLWVSTFAGAYWLEGARWHSPKPEWGLPMEPTFGLLQARDGTFWVATQTAAWRRGVGETRFRHVDDLEGLSYFAMGPDGRVWINSGRRGVWPAGEPRRPAALTPLGDKGLEASEVFFDRSGGVWVAADGRAARLPADQLRGPWPWVADFGRLAAQADASVFRLGGTHVGGILEDREGQVWIVTSGGVDRFREATVKAWPLAEGWRWPSLAPDASGGVWVGDARGRVRHSRRPEANFQTGTETLTAMSQHCGPEVWAASRAGLHRLGGHGLEASVSLPEISGEAVVQGVLCLGDGRMLLSRRLSGLWLGRAGQWARVQGPARVEGPPWYPLVMTRSDDGTVWMGDAAGAVWRLDDLEVSPVLVPARLALGAVLSLLPQGRGLWIGGERGLALLEGHEVRPIHLPQGDVVGVSGLVQDGEGGLWVHAATGLVRLTRLRSQNLIQGLPQMRARWFGPEEGVYGQSVQLRPLPSAVLAGDGTLWLATANGLSFLNPQRLNPLRDDLQVVLSGVTITGQSLIAEADAFHLPLGERDAQVNFRADTLRGAASVRFQMRELDSTGHWRELGEQQSVRLSALTPGTHAWLLRVVNEEGQPSRRETLVRLHVPAYWHEWAWLRGLAWLCLLVGVTAGLMFWQRRRQGLALLQLKASMRERDRIARDLHDTLLQGLQGLVLVLHGVVERMPSADPQQGRLRACLDQAERWLHEGRDRVVGLRQAPSLPAMWDELCALGESLAAQMGGEFRREVRGCLDDVTAPPDVVDQLRLMCREALLNAFRHAMASCISLTFVSKPGELAVSILDDGIGIPAAWVHAQGKGDHLGLVNMRERAERCGARLRIDSVLGRGTRIDIVVSIVTTVQGRRAPWWKKIKETLHGHRSI